MATTRIMPLHAGKGWSVARVLRDVKDYMENPLKTEDGEFISSFGCAPETADSEFLLSKSRYLSITGRNQGRRDVLAYHIRQSFKPGEITPQEANAIGYELAMRFTKGSHAFIVCTHIDRSHIHNHVVWNSTNLDCTKKWRDFFRSGRALRRLSDTLCVEHGLSVIENPAPGRGKHYGAWLDDAAVVDAARTALRKRVLSQDLMDMLIDRILVYPDDRIEILWKLSGFVDCMPQTSENFVNSITMNDKKPPWPF